MIPTPRELAGYTLERQHPLSRAWAEDATRLKALAKQHEEVDILLATDRDIAAARVEKTAPGTPVESMLNYWVPVSDDLSAMLSMRFEGMDPTKPFVDASPLSRALRTEDLPALAAAATRYYAIHNPTYLRLWSAEPVGAFPGTGPDRRFLAAPIDQLQPRDVPPGLEVTPARNVDHYDDARRAYDAVDHAHPAHAVQAHLQDREDLEESAEAGLLFDVTVDGTWAGYVSALADGEDTLGLPAYIVQEIILTPEYRGRGLGTHLSTLMAQALPDPSRILIGCIHADNTGATRAATTAGRQDLGGWLQVPLTTT